jgi:hypothetical protein
MSREDEQEDMRRRKITLADGRYMIFYTFEQRRAPSASDNGEGAEEARREPEPVAEAEEERSV